MFDSNKKIENRQLVIVFNDETEKIANYLYNKLHGTIKCVLWPTKVYKENVPIMMNTNKILVYDEDLIEELFPYPEKENITNLNCGAKFIRQGPRAGFVVDKSFLHNKFMQVRYSKKKWKLTLDSFLLFPFYLEFIKFRKNKMKSLLKVATDEILVHLLFDFIEGEKSTDC